jgi:hypothetical protein
MKNSNPKMIKTDAGEFAEIRLSIRMPKPMWRVLNSIAHEMHNANLPVRCPVFGDDIPAIASIIRAIVMTASSGTMVRIGAAPPIAPRSVADAVAEYIAVGYGQNSAIPTAPIDRDGVDSATGGQSDHEPT